MLFLPFIWFQRKHDTSKCESESLFHGQDESKSSCGVVPGLGLALGIRAKPLLEDTWPVLLRKWPFSEGGSTIKRKTYCTEASECLFSDTPADCDEHTLRKYLATVKTTLLYPLKRYVLAQRSLNTFSHIFKRIDRRLIHWLLQVLDSLKKLNLQQHQQPQQTPPTSFLLAFKHWLFLVSRAAPHRFYR